MLKIEVMRQKVIAATIVTNSCHLNTLLDYSSIPNTFIKRDLNKSMGTLRSPGIQGERYTGGPSRLQRSPSLASHCWRNTPRLSVRSRCKGLDSRFLNYLVNTISSCEADEGIHAPSKKETPPNYLSIFILLVAFPQHRHEHTLDRECCRESIEYFIKVPSPYWYLRSALRPCPQHPSKEQQVGYYADYPVSQ